MKLLQEGAIVKYTDGSDIVFNNAKYLDNGVEKTGTLSIVKNGDEVGVKLADAGSDLLDAIYNTQKGVISKYKGSISNASRNAKGVFGEVATDVKFTENGFEALHVRKGQNGDLLDGWGETGLDHVFKKDGKYYIVDSKYGTAKLNKNTIDGPQMGDSWIGGSNRLNNAVGDVDLAGDILDSDYIRIVSNISDDGSIILKELDEFGEVIGDFSF